MMTEQQKPDLAGVKSPPRMWSCYKSRGELKTSTEVASAVLIDYMQ